MTQIKFDPKNYRKHGEKNKQLIHSSLKDNGAGRSILLDKEDVIIAGNGVYEQAQELGLTVRVIESDGSELIAIKRTDLATSDEKRKLLAVADNKTSDTSEFDFEMLADDFEIETLEELGFDTIDFDSLNVSMLDDMEQNAFAGNIASESATFDFTLSIPQGQREMVEAFVKANTKAPLVDNLLNFIKDA